MGDVMKYGKFVLGVAASILIISQVPALKALIEKKYWGD